MHKTEGELSRAKYVAYLGRLCNMSTDRTKMVHLNLVTFLLRTPLLRWKVAGKRLVVQYVSNCKILHKACKGHISQLG